MSSEFLSAAQNVLKGNLGGAWDIKHGYAGAYTNLGIARRFGGTKVAYSLRDIGAMNGPVCEIRRSSDNAVENFSASQLASGAATAFVGGSNDGFVSKWYDQSGNGIHAVNTTTGEQPKIIESGTYLASLKFDADTDASNPDFLATTSKVGNSTDFFVSYVIANKANQSDFAGVLGSRSGTSEGYVIGVANDERPQIFIYGSTAGGEPSNSKMPSAAALGSSETVLITYQRDGQEVKGFANGTERSSYTSRPMGAIDVDKLTIGAGGRIDTTVSAGLKGELKEIVFYETDRTDDRTEIEADIARYYGL